MVKILDGIDPVGYIPPSNLAEIKRAIVEKGVDLVELNVVQMLSEYEKYVHQKVNEFIYDMMVPYAIEVMKNAKRKKLSSGDLLIAMKDSGTKMPFVDVQSFIKGYVKKKDATSCP